MGTQEPFGQRGRLIAAIVLLVSLGLLFVWYPSVTHDPTMNYYPDEVEVTPNPDNYVDERVVLGGEVVDTDPVVVATRASGYGRFVLVDADDNLQNSNEPLEPGDRVSAFGVLEDDSTLIVERATTREPSDERYMYIVSFLGGLWVLGRFVQGWRFDRDTLAFVPRQHSLTLRRLIHRGSRSTQAQSSSDQQQNHDLDTSLRRRGIEGSSDGGRHG